MLTVGLEMFWWAPTPAVTVSRAAAIVVLIVMSVPGPWADRAVPHARGGRRSEVPMRRRASAFPTDFTRPVAARSVGPNRVRRETWIAAKAVTASRLGLMTCIGRLDEACRCVRAVREARSGFTRTRSREHDRGQRWRTTIDSVPRLRRSARTRPESRRPDGPTRHRSRVDRNARPFILSANRHRVRRDETIRRRELESPKHGSRRRPSSDEAPYTGVRSGGCGNELHGGLE